MPRRGLLFLLLSVLLGALAAPVAAQFVDRADAAGVNVNFPTSPSGHSEPGIDPYSVGGAASAADLDGDGWVDLLVARTGQPSLVFMNNRNGTFREEAAARGLASLSDVGGFGIADLDNDGDQDVFMTPVSGPRYHLFLNDGTGNFREAAVERGADVPVTEFPHRGQSVSFVDYDRDGFLDVYVAEWNVLSGAENDRHSVLLRNRGRTAPGFFENRTAAAGLTQPAISSLMANYGTAWADYDGDGWPDLMLIGDFDTTQMWWNNGDGTFTNGTDSSGVRGRYDGMGFAVFDFDADGKLDVFISAIDLINESSITDRGFISDNRLFRYFGNRQFVEMAVPAGVKESGWGWGAGYLDANLDGLPDLAVTNGYVAPTPQFARARTDPTKFFLNQGGTFTDATSTYGVTDNGLGRSLVVLDYDNDGRPDFFVTQTEGRRYLYRNQTTAGLGRWISLRFVGTQSNRDGIGALVTVTAGGRSQTAIYNPSNAYIGQREPRLHFGLGAVSNIERIRVVWPSGTVQELTGVSADQFLTVTEPGAPNVPNAAPVFTAGPAGGPVQWGSSVTLSATATGTPAPVYNWFKDGVRLTGATSSSLTLHRIRPTDAGNYTVTASNSVGTVTSAPAALTVTADPARYSAARWWNELLLDSIRRDVPNPPVHARNLYHVSAALWDAFWAYERNGWTGRREVFTRETPTLPAGEAERIAAQREAMSYAAFTVLRSRFARSVGVAASTTNTRWLMQLLGYNPDFTDASGGSPAAVGLRIGQRVLDLNRDDGANDANLYADLTGYRVANPPLLTQVAGVGAGVDPDRWQPLNLANTITQNGIVLGSSIQSFVGVNAVRTRPWALVRAGNGFLADDPGPPPRFADAATRAEFVRQAREVIELSAQLDPRDGQTMDISPGRWLNNPLGSNAGTGRSVNPVTGQAYAANVVARGDIARILAEYWADGPESETPPGHWNVIFNEVSDHPGTNRRFGGQGTALPRLEWDVVGYLALNTAVHDAALAAWTLKWQYDSSRPITMIRYLAALGQSSNPSGPNYHAGGLPLVPGLIEQVTTESSAPGQRHAHLAGAVGQVAVRAWLGTPPNHTMTSGVGWILGVHWMPYQRETFVTPAFPAYVSGHSTFSRAAAEVMARITGSEFFPGGLYEKTFAQGNALAFEYGPSQLLRLQAATYYDAADQAGLSRLYGGIHIAADDFIGRRVGSRTGIDAFAKFQQHYGSNVSAPPPGAAGNAATGETPTTPTPPTTPTTPTTPSTGGGGAGGGGGGGGGGAPSLWFALTVAVAAAARALQRRPQDR